MAWIRWHETKRGARLASVQWRDRDGCVRSRALKTSDPRLAEMHRRATEAEEEGKAPCPVTVDADEALTRFLSHIKLTRAAATHSYYEGKLDPLWKDWRMTPMGLWSRPMFEGYIATHREAWSPRQIQMVVTACRRFIRWAQESAVACPDFVGSFRGPTVYSKAPMALTRDQRDALLAHAKGHDLEPAVGLTVLAGLRRNEMLHARADDIDWDAKMLLVHGTKTHQDRHIPINATLLDILKRHRRLAGPLVRVAGKHNHSNRRRSLHVLCKNAGVPRVSWHPLRHTYGTLLAATGTDLPTIQRLMGHKRGSTTTIYLHTDPKRMAEAVERIA